jgi:hypothetical protein
VLGDVGEPQPVRGGGGELAVDQVTGRLRVWVAHRAAAASSHVQATDAGLAHEPGHPLLVHDQAEPESQFSVHPRGPVRFSRLLVNFGDAFEQQFVLVLPRRGRPVTPFVVPGPGYTQ